MFLGDCSSFGRYCKWPIDTFDANYTWIEPSTWGILMPMEQPQRLVELENVDVGDIAPNPYNCSCIISAYLFTLNCCLLHYIFIY